MMFFGPSLGLFNLLNHWKREQVRFKPQTEGGPFVEGGNFTTHNVSIDWTELERNVSSLGQTSYTIYTGVSIKWLYVMFIAAMVVDTIVVYLVKNCTSSHFRNCTDRLTKVLHAVHNLHMPHLFGDWDIGDHWDLRQHKNQWAAAQREMGSLIGIKTVENLLMLIPLLYTGWNVRQRHHTMTSLGKSPFPDEYISYDIASFLMWLMPLLVILSALFEYTIFIVYNKLGHPWKDILKASLEEMDGGKEVAEVASVRPNKNVRLVSVESISEEA